VRNCRVLTGTLVEVLLLVVTVEVDRVLRLLEGEVGAGGRKAVCRLVVRDGV